MGNSIEGQIFLYKYKALATACDIIRICDIIENHRIYLPKYLSLNDPFEGSGINLKLRTGYAGCSMSDIYDTEYSVFAYEKEKYKILSLSELPDSPQLWAHYSGNYTGCSLIFNVTGPFSQAKKVKYIKERPAPIYTDSLTDKILEEEFFIKSWGWSYEKEWRIISKESPDYLCFDKSDLFGIIFGNRVDKEIYYFLNNYINRIYPDNTFKIYRAWPGKQSYAIRFTRGDQFELAGGGENVFVNIGD